MVKNNEWSKERLFSFAMTEEDADKTAFLKTLSRQLATNACTADSVSQLPQNSGILVLVRGIVNIFVVFCRISFWLI